MNGPGGPLPADFRLKNARDPKERMVSKGRLLESPTESEQESIVEYEPEVVTRNGTIFLSRNKKNTFERLDPILNYWHISARHVRVSDSCPLVLTSGHGVSKKTLTQKCAPVWMKQDGQTLHV
jgi:hypothetical protein